jgi:hypothetical protein
MDKENLNSEGRTPLSFAEYMLESIDPKTVSFIIDGEKVAEIKKETLLSLSQMFLQFYNEGFQE